MPTDELRPMCFIAMPFGKRAPTGKRKPLIDFDRVHAHIAAAAAQAGLEPIRADFEPAGGFIHRPMLERLLVAEYVIADLTLSNPNVLYEVGVRHGAGGRATLLICADRYLAGLPFDVRPLRVLPYSLAEDGVIGDVEGRKLTESLAERLGMARRGELPADNPILQVTAWKPAGTIQHSKTDVFLQRLQFTGRLGERIKAAVALSDRSEAVRQLAAIEEEVVGLPADVAQVHTALLGVFLGYREKEEFARMRALFERFPNELKETAVAREQYALALNRLAEEADRDGRGGEAEDMRRAALAALDAIPADRVTSETYGIRGRVFKGWHDALARRNENRATAMLAKAIEAYEQGFQRDLRDYYPGVNAVTLRLLRATEADHEALRMLIPVVRYSVAVAPPPKNEQERYWQAATRLELATAARDWLEARRHLTDLLGIPVQPWMRKTTVDNLERQQKALSFDASAAAQLSAIVEQLSKS